MTERRDLNPCGRASRAALVLAGLLLAALLLPTGTAQVPRDKGLPQTAAGEGKPAGDGKKQEKGKQGGQKGKEAEPEKGLLVNARLELTDPIDKDPDRKSVGHHAKTYPFKMIAGHRYVIDMTSGEFDAWLRLLDASGTQVMFNDDNGVSQNARIDYLAPRTETYRIVATTFMPGATGQFQLQVTPLRPGMPVPPPPGPVGGVPIVMPGPAGMAFPGLRMEATFGGITVTSEPPLLPVNRGMNDTHGYLEYRLTVRNKSAEAHRVALTVPRSRPGMMRGESYLRSLRRAVEVGPESTAVVSLFQPDLPIHFGSDVEVEIDGQVQTDALFLNVQTDRGRGRGGMRGGPGMGMAGMVGAYLLAPQELAATLDGNAGRSVLDEPAARRGVVSPGAFGMRSYPGAGGTPLNYPVNHAFTAAPEPKAWGREHWLGYSCFDGVALRGGQLEEMSAATRAALWRYVECGGSLLIVGSPKVPDGWKRTAAAPAGLTAYYPGFGQCLVATEANPGKWTPAQWRAVLAMWERSAQPFQQVRSANDANSLFPVVEDRGVPVRGLFAGMFVFAILVGPVNVYLLTRKKRRIWLLWTVPVFSLLTCAAVFGAMVISEGWSGHVRVTGVTVLDETSQRASSVGWLGVYSPITPGGGLHFGYDTEVTPQLREDFRGYGYRREGAARTIDWTNDQHFASGWVKALMPAHFAVRTSDQRLERLAVTRGADGTLKAVNALKAPVARLWLADAKGQIHTAENIPAGKEAVLKASGQKAEGKAESLREAFSGDWLTLSKTLTVRPELFLRPGTYLAELDGAPFLEKGLRGAQLRPGRSVVFGILKEVPGDAR